MNCFKDSDFNLKCVQQKAAFSKTAYQFSLNF